MKDIFSIYKNGELDVFPHKTGRQLQPPPPPAYLEVILWTFLSIKTSTGAKLLGEVGGEKLEMYTVQEEEGRAWKISLGKE